MLRGKIQETCKDSNIELLNTRYYFCFSKSRNWSCEAKSRSFIYISNFEIAFNYMPQIFVKTNDTSW